MVTVIKKSECCDEIDVQINESRLHAGVLLTHEDFRGELHITNIIR